MLDPSDTEAPASRAFVRIRSTRDLRRLLDSSELSPSVRESGLLGSGGEGLVCVLSPGLLPVDAFVVMDALQQLTEDPEEGRSIVAVTQNGIPLEQARVCSRDAGVDIEWSAEERPVLGIFSPTARLADAVGLIRHLLQNGATHDGMHGKSFRHICDIVSLSPRFDHGTDDSTPPLPFIDSISASAPWTTLLKFSRETNSYVADMCHRQHNT